jgi:ribonuclease PH
VFDDLPLLEHMAAVSICQLNGQLVLDPNYHEDSQADMDSNIVLTESGKVLELQMTAESGPVEASKVAEMMQLAEKGVKEIISAQKEALKTR